MSLLLEAYDKLPQPRPGDDPDLLHAGVMDAMREFRAEVRSRYTEGTLQRLVESAGCEKQRRAAALAFGLIGTMRSNAALAAALHDPDSLVRKLAADSLWEVWFRAGTDAQNAQLRQAMQLPDHLQAVAALDELVKEAPDFAEAVNQRAILRFRRGEYTKSAADCETVLRLNPFHFGAAAGLGQCYLRMNRPRAALRAFRQALQIRPDLDGVTDTVRGLEASLEKDTSEGE
jgi:tetratricopeptide (TPR) repeat protein